MTKKRKLGEVRRERDAAAAEYGVDSPEYLALASEYDALRELRARRKEEFEKSRAARKAAMKKRGKSKA